MLTVNGNSRWKLQTIISVYDEVTCTRRILIDRATIRVDQYFTGPYKFNNKFGGTGITNLWFDNGSLHRYHGPAVITGFYRSWVDNYTIIQTRQETQYVYENESLQIG